MRHFGWPILVACLSVPVLGQEAPHSIYDNIASMEAIGGAPASGATTAPGTSAQADYDAAKQRFDAASDQLMYARNDVLNRLAGDAKYQAANRDFATAKNQYDDEIDDALWSLSYDEEYQQLVDAANRAEASLQSLNEFSQGQPDAKELQYAQQRVDEARRAVEDDEDGVLDHDTSVQQARQKFEAARAARDRIVSDAMAADQKVQEAQANVNREQIALDAAAAKLGQNAVAQNGGPQAPTSPLPTVEGVQPPPSADQTAGAPLSSSGPVIYDAGDGTEVGPSYVPETYEPAYSYDEDLNSPYYYPPYYSYYPYGYLGGVFLYNSSRDHHRFYDRDYFRGHDRDHDRGSWSRGSDGRHGDWNGGDWRSRIDNSPSQEARLAGDRQNADQSSRGDEVRQREEWRERMSQQMNDAAARQSQADRQGVDQRGQSNRGSNVWTGRSGDPQPTEEQRQAAEQHQQQREAERQQQSSDQQQHEAAAQQRQAEENAREQQAEAQSRASQAAAERQAAAQQQQAAQARQSSESSHSSGGYSGGGRSSSGGGGGGSHGGGGGGHHR